MDEEKRTVNLDPEAQRIFEQFAGLETWQASEHASVKDLAQSLLEEQQRHDKVRILMVRLAFLIRNYLASETLSGYDRSEPAVFEEFSELLKAISQGTAHLGFALIRFRGVSLDPELPSKLDYEFIVGNTMIDNQLSHRVARRCGKQFADLPDLLMQCCTVLADYGVSNLYIRLPDETETDHSATRLCLKALAGFRLARQTGSPIKVYNENNELVFPVINDENLFPDPNLTMLAGINQISQTAMETLVGKVDAWLRKQTRASKEKRYAGVYNATLDLPKLRARVKRPTIELNNVKWLLTETEDEAITLEQAHLAKLVMETSGASPIKAAKILQSVYGKDYAKINVPILGERLNLSTDLLYSLEKRPQESHLKKEVLGNLQLRLDEVKDNIIDEILVREDKGEEVPEADKQDGHAVHSQIYNMMSFFKGRSNTRKKMTSMVHRSIEFTAEDYDILAKDFRISLEEAQALVATLKGCFQNDGSFIKPAFTAAIPHFSKYEQKIFHFLWHHMKDVILTRDRLTFLNSLQSLTAQMDQPKRAFKILLEDLCSEPLEIKFSDDKAVMLANLVIQKDKSLTTYEITPEDIVLNRHSIDTVVAKYASWRIEKDNEDFLSKVQTVHKQLSENLSLEKPVAHRVPTTNLLNLERELYIFLSLVECEIGKTVLKSAVSEYGNPEAAIYHQKQSSSFLSGLLQNLRVALRGVGTLGSGDDIGLLERVKTQEETFLRLKNDRHYRSQARLISEWVDESVKFIKFRS